MYCYDIGYWTCESDRKWQYYHEKKFTDDELFDVVVECLKPALKDALEVGWSSAIDPEDWKEYRDKQDKKMCIKLRAYAEKECPKYLGVENGD